MFNFPLNFPNTPDDFSSMQPSPGEREPIPMDKAWLEIIARQQNHKFLSHRFRLLTHS